MGGLLKNNHLKNIIFLTLFFSPAVYAVGNAVSPLPNPPSAKDEKTELGALLYRDPVFSENFSISCNSCHSLQKNGVDQLPTYQGLDKAKGNLNTPTTLNSKLNFRQFWNGRASNFSEVIDDHLTNKTIFASNWHSVIKRFESNDTYIDLFKRNFLNGEINPENIKDALITFLDNLVTPKSSFDKFLNGDENAISQEAKDGFELFKDYGCITCHQGPNLGGNLFQKLGIYKDYYPPTESNPVNLGLFVVSKELNDKFVFKVPGLRNVTLTAPYLHDGSIKTLEEMIRIMGVYQIGQLIPDDDIKLIIKFLETLNGIQAYK